MIWVRGKGGACGGEWSAGAELRAVFYFIFQFHFINIIPLVIPGVIQFSVSFPRQAGHPSLTTFNLLSLPVLFLLIVTPPCLIMIII